MISKISIEKALPYLLRPIVRLCVRYAVKFHDVESALKELFVAEAKNHLLQLGQANSLSKISIMTGLQRPAVKAYLNKSRVPSGESLLNKVIGAWVTKDKFITSHGAPRVLTVDGKSSQFASLVYSVSQSLNPYTVLFELERANLVRRTPKGIQLLSNSFNSRHDIEQSLKYLASDISDLAATIEHNITSTTTTPNHHLTTEYDNIPANKLDKIKSILLIEGDKIHRKIRKILSKFDCDISGASYNKESIRVSFCSFATSEVKNKI
jgi:hypothetical protein